MSQTESMAQPPAPGQRTITLHNGQVVTFSSDEPTTMETIPIIDAARIWSDRLEDRESVAEEIREASRQIGFFYLINHVSNQAHRTKCPLGGEFCLVLPRLASR